MSKKIIVKNIKSSESTISMVLGVVVVLVVGVMLVNYFRGNNSLNLEKVKNAVKTEFQNDNDENTKDEVAQTGLPQKYTVKAGDSLWKISENYFGSGYNWVDIKNENGLTSPDSIETGQILTIPNVPAKVKTTVDSSVSVEKSITDKSYVVVKGDSLWDISVRAYQDGFKWPEIAKANNITNPGIIHPGNVLVIPR